MLLLRRISLSSAFRLPPDLVPKSRPPHKPCPAPSLAAPTPKACSKASWLVILDGLPNSRLDLPPEPACCFCRSSPSSCYPAVAVLCAVLSSEWRSYHTTRASGSPASVGMEVGVAVASAVARSVVPKLVTAIEKRGRGLEDIGEEIRSLQRELDMISGYTKDQISHMGQHSHPEIVSMKEFCDLAHNIEDCLDRFIPCAECGKGEVQIRDPNKFREEISRLKWELDEAQRRRDRYVVAESSVDNNSTADEVDTGTYGACPAVGMDEAKAEVWASLVDGQASKLKVVSIVGFGGSGKTALAWELYNCPQAAEQFSCRAWATVTSKHKHDVAAKEGLLTAILEGLLGVGEEARGAVPQKLLQLQQHIRLLLQTKRCLIVIDNIKMELWDAIKPIFPEKTESRILVTTAMTSVANACSLPGGYVYSMRSLSAKRSKDYLDKVFGESSPDLERGSTAIVNKCDGHPLALVTVAKALQDHNVLTGDLCEQISKNLCSRMDENKNGHFTKLRQVLMNSYSSLPGNSFRTCLLYTSIFPNDLPFSTKSLIRRLSAEGYIEGDDQRSAQQVAYDHLDELIDRNIIRPIDAHNNSKVKTCKTHGIMNQLMLHKSRSSNFIATSFSDKNRSNCRHLVIQNHRNGNSFAPATSGKGKQLRPRSLTVFGSAEEAVSDLQSCELLRVLDLKECNDLKDQHLKYIYKLLHLKYLNLGSSVSKPFDGMEKLHCLETLDLRTSKIETLPAEVISLPHLAHLLGKITIKKFSNKELNKFLSKECSLKTVAGVIVDSTSGFPALMVHMKQLRKVKIWCEPTSTDCNNILDSLSMAIQKFAKAGIDTPVGDHCRLSLHFNNYCDRLLHHLDNTTVTGYLSSLKLQGILRQFPQFVMPLSGLRELCLTSTNLAGDDLLRNLRKLLCLIYLKLVEVHLADFQIEDGDLPSLQRVCFVLQEPRFPTIQQGALPRLTSIQLLCKDLEDVCDIKLEWFKDIQEIALDSMVNQETIKLWEDEAKKHPKRPRVLLLKRFIDPAKTSPSVKYVSSCQVNNNCYTDTCTIDHMEIDLKGLTLQPEPERIRTGLKYRRSDQFIIGSKRSRSPHSPERA